MRRRKEWKEGHMKKEGEEEIKTLKTRKGKSRCEVYAHDGIVK